jgi:Mn-dependent DtxR family transcriptional regulator
MTSIHTAFSKSYAEARQKFLSAAQQAGLQVQSHAHPETGRDGEALAERVRARHRLVVDLLVAIGVPPDSAEADAEGIEHHVSDAALDAFRQFLARR